MPAEIAPAGQTVTSLEVEGMAFSAALFPCEPQAESASARSGETAARASMEERMDDLAVDMKTPRAAKPMRHLHDAT